MKVNYKITSGVALHEAIENDDAEQTVKCLLFCYKELQSKLTEEDEDWKGCDIEDAIFNLENFDPGEDVNDYLDWFYGLCDELGAWICTINENV